MGRRVGLGLWLVLLAGVQAAGLFVVWRFFVRTAHGQLLDFVALTGNRVGRTRIENLVNTILGTVSVLSLGVATVVIGFIALTRRRIAVAVGALLLIAGANVSAQLLKLRAKGLPVVLIRAQPMRCHSGCISAISHADRVKTRREGFQRPLRRGRIRHGTPSRSRSFSAAPSPGGG